MSAAFINSAIDVSRAFIEKGFQSFNLNNVDGDNLIYVTILDGKIFTVNEGETLYLPEEIVIKAKDQ